MSDSVESSISYPAPEAAGGDEEEKLEEGAGVADLGSLLEGVEGFNDNRRVPALVTEASQERDLG